MLVSEIPIGQKFVVADNRNIKIVVTRLSENDCIQEQFAPATGKVVLRVKVGIHSGASDLEYVDHSFWTVTVDGRPFDSGDNLSTSGMNMNTNAEFRTLKFTTK